MKPKASKNPESVVRKIKRKTRRKFNSEEKIRIILEGLKGEDSLVAAGNSNLKKDVFIQFSRVSKLYQSRPPPAGVVRCVFER